MRVYTISPHPNAKTYIENLAASGRYHFSSRDARSALGVSADGVKLALNRLTKQGRIASPSRGFYVIVPPEYRSVGCLPADQFIPALMKRAGLLYYAGLLSAAQYYGAAHQRPQEFQVFLEKNRRPIKCSAVRVAFFARKRIADIPVRSFNTPRGTILVSTPEATAIDLVGCQRHAGGLDQVATILTELAEMIDPDLMAEAAVTAPLPWAQRLGYLLSLVGASDKTTPLKNHVLNQAKQYAPLLPSAPVNIGSRAKDWKLSINTIVEPEL